MVLPIKEGGTQKKIGWAHKKRGVIISKAGFDTKWNGSMGKGGKKRKKKRVEKAEGPAFPSYGHRLYDKKKKGH